MKHNKEYKMLGFGDESAKKYVYGKLNYVNVLRVGIGRRKLIFEKFRNNGVQFTANVSSGLSLGCARPVYLQIYKRDFNGVPIAVVPERYDASQHGYYDIYGRGPRFRGLFEYSFNPGTKCITIPPNENFFKESQHVKFYNFNLKLYKLN